MSDPGLHPTIETEKTFDPLRAATPLTSQPLPTELIELSRSRIRLVSGFLLAAVAVVWPLTTGLRGVFLAEFEHVNQWGPVVFVIASSAGMFALTYARRVSGSALLRIAWGYQVAVSFGWAFMQYLGVFEWIPPEQINVDQFGTSGVALWMFFFTVLVPGRPLFVLGALLLSATAVPATYLVTLATAGMPPVSATNFLIVLVLPYVLTAVAAAVAARSLYRLRLDAIRARQLGAYRLDSLIGKGGMGEVWRGTHRYLARPAAIKLIRREALGRDPTLAQAALARFEREAQVTASLRSPHTVELFDYGIGQDGTIYYVMELLDGIDFDQLVRHDGTVPPERVIVLLRQVCASLGEAHMHGLVHRDIKPANLYLCRLGVEYDFVKVLDFGLVKPAQPTGSSEHPELTQADMVPGTPSFMAPEAVRGEQVDGRADLYAVGCVAYWLLTGHPVFEGPTPLAVLSAHAAKQPVPPSQRAGTTLPPGLEALVLRCLAKEPGERYQTAGELADALAQVETPVPWTKARAAEWWGGL